MIESPKQAAEQGAAPDRLQPYVSLVPRFTPGFRRRVSLVVRPQRAAWMFAIISQCVTIIQNMESKWRAKR